MNSCKKYKLGKLINEIRGFAFKGECFSDASTNELNEAIKENL